MKNISLIHVLPFSNVTQVPTGKGGFGSMGEVNDDCSRCSYDDSFGRDRPMRWNSITRLMRIETFVRISSRMRKTFGLIEGEHHGEPLVSLTTVHLSTAFDPLTSAALLHLQVQEDEVYPSSCKVQHESQYQIFIPCSSLQRMVQCIRERDDVSSSDGSA